MLKIGGWNVTEKLMDRGERLWPPYAYLYISPFSLDLFGSFSIYIYIPFLVVFINSLERTFDTVAV